MSHPSPDVPAMRVATEARALADGLGLTGRHVFFNEGWVDYESRQDYLLEADVGVSAHIDHLEASLSFRARILDYLWAGLPVVATQGDVLADLVERRGLGVTVPAGDVDAMAAALAALLDDPDRRQACRANIAAVVARADVGAGPRPAGGVLPGAPEGTRPGRPHRRRARRALEGLGHDLSVGLDYLRRGGARLVAEKAWGRARRLVRRPR